MPPGLGQKLFSLITDWTGCQINWALLALLNNFCPDIKIAIILHSESFLSNVCQPDPMKSWRKRNSIAYASLVSSVIANFVQICLISGQNKLFLFEFWSAAELLTKQQLKNANLVWRVCGRKNPITKILKGRKLFLYGHRFSRVLVTRGVYLT